VPIVMANSSDPAVQGLVSSLARPGGNITGFTGNTGPEFEAKKIAVAEGGRAKCDPSGLPGAKD
jgi:putative ABC transport system substrate-binding protein